MRKICVGILFGGCSAEYCVSINSAKGIVGAINKNIFKVVLFGINRYGTWYVLNSIDEFVYKNNFENNNIFHFDNIQKGVVLFPGFPRKFMKINDIVCFYQLDIVFPVTHGMLGEDGTLQGFLQILGVPYVGSGVLSSAICMNKNMTKCFLRDIGLMVSPSFSLSYSELNNISFDSVVKRIGLPFLVKPVNQGSSLGISKVISQNNFYQSLVNAFNFDSEILLERFIHGMEITCAVLGNKNNLCISFCGEIVLLSDDFYSYNIKYIDNKNVKIIIPARINDNINNRIQDICEKIFLSLNFYEMIRVDLFLTADEEIVINEINTLPGFSEDSLYPKLWKKSNLSYTDLITRVIKLALERFYGRDSKKFSF
ncbi:MAG: D-alanine--D-alanine ligase A [Candidatus Westeberhardia cardiocondylae]|nr:D-alanine--D-alanine ligase A [Candidatus Westeberhardia cardiocondylae]